MHATFTGYGSDGPDAQRPGYDVTAFFGRSGLYDAMREGADFDDNGGELLSTAVDGVIYRVQASTDLTDFLGETVGEIPGFTAPGTLPALPDGWEYRGFETSKSIASEPQQFLRVVAEPAP